MRRGGLLLREGVANQPATQLASFFFHAIALALAGRAKESKTSVRHGLELEPGFPVRLFSEFGMARPIAEKFAEGARLLGLPEGSVFCLPAVTLCNILPTRGPARRAGA